MGGMASRVCGARFVADTKREGEYVPDRGNPLAEPARIPADLIGTVLPHHDGARNKDGARNQEKKCLASRGDAKSKG